MNPLFKFTLAFILIFFECTSSSEVKSNKEGCATFKHDCMADQACLKFYIAINKECEAKRNSEAERGAVLFLTCLRNRSRGNEKIEKYINCLHSLSIESAHKESDGTSFQLFKDCDPTLQACLSDNQCLYSVQQIHSRCEPQSKDKKAYRECFDRWRPKSEHSREIFNAYFQCLQDNIKRPIFLGLGCLSIIILPLIIYFRPDGCGEPDKEKYKRWRALFHTSRGAKLESKKL